MQKLRIFYASDTTPNAWFKSIRSNIWRNNLLLPLQDLGHDVVEFAYDLTDTFRYMDPANPRHVAFMATNRPKVTEEILRQIRAAHAIEPIDVFFSYFFDACILPEAIDEIRALGVKTVNWYCNGSYQLHLVREIAPHYDWCLVPEKFRMKDYVAMNAHPIYCQEAANPSIYKPYDLPVEFPVAFVGQAYGDRPILIKHLLDAGIDVRAWGQSWVEAPRAPISEAVAAIPADRRGGPLPDEEMVQMYSRAKINLGFSSCGETHRSGERILQVRLRDFEVPMSGGFYMVEYMEELEEFFHIGKEIVCYTGADDLVEKIRYYLAHDDERERIRRAGFDRCRRDHTWHRRFQTAFAQMHLAPARPMEPSAA
jgi:spore maturation protein CgeB